MQWGVRFGTSADRTLILNRCGHWLKMTSTIWYSETRKIAVSGEPEFHAAFDKKVIDYA